ncbi:hypothetical protein Tco_0307133 [Tanacetum coccineum]
MNDGVDVDFTSDTNHLNLFDNHLSRKPYDERRATLDEDGRASSSRTNNAPLQYSSSVRRYSRSGKFPAKFNDYVVKSIMRYGLEEHVNYVKLSVVNYCFAAALNKSAESEIFNDVVKYNN